MRAPWAESHGTRGSTKRASSHGTSRTMPLRAGGILSIPGSTPKSKRRCAAPIGGTIRALAEFHALGARQLAPVLPVPLCRRQ
eukprot:15481429-Alexandrium_andersonii.AAC.1